MNTSTTTAREPGNYASVNGISMYYEIHGSGNPLVLIHGGGSTITTSFSTILPALAKEHRVIAVEMQAHGRTSDRNAPETFQQDADDIAELLKQLNIAKADIFGFSNGAQTAMDVAIRYPQLVNKLILASMFYKRNGAPEGFWTGFQNPRFSDMPQVYKDEFLKINNDTAALLNMFSKDAERMKNFKGWTDDQVKSIKAPALLVMGDNDLPTFEHIIEMHRNLKQSRLAILPGNHGSYMGEAMSWGTKSNVPELFAALVNEFLTPSRHTVDY
ncbi:MAG TPA: alpha/beta hydrolase [Cyclobacteriaceae bacterium]|nr:alpha/beta hydrolase [Cyclobacteriaceae bacterium]